MDQKVNIVLESNWTFFKNHDEFAKKHLKISKKFSSAFCDHSISYFKKHKLIWKGQKIAQAMYIVSLVIDDVQRVYVTIALTGFPKSKLPYSTSYT